MSFFNTKKIIAISLISVCSIGLCFSANCSKENWKEIELAWMKYLDHPIKKNATILYLLLPGKGFNYSDQDKEQSRVIEVIFESLNKFEKLLNEGTRDSLRIALKLTIISDGAFTEYLFDILGNFVCGNPTLFIEELKNFMDIYNDSVTLIKGIICYTLPEPNIERTDDEILKERIKKINCRISAIEKIERVDIFEIKNICLEYLYKEKKVLENN